MCYKSSGHIANLVPPERVNDTVSQDASCRGTHNASVTQDTSLAYRTRWRHRTRQRHTESVSDTGHVSDTQKASVTKGSSGAIKTPQGACQIASVTLNNICCEETQGDDASLNMISFKHPIYFRVTPLFQDLGFTQYR